VIYYRETLLIATAFEALVSFRRLPFQHLRSRLTNHHPHHRLPGKCHRPRRRHHLHQCREYREYPAHHHRHPHQLHLRHRQG